MIQIRYVQDTDKEFWFRLDKHLSEDEFARKVRDKMGYVLLADEAPVGLLRYNLFWDSIPFCNLLFVDLAYQKKGYGRMLMEYWEADMKAQGFDMLMTSTQVDETAQHFYRKLGYNDSGSLLLDTQAMEMFLVKKWKAGEDND